MTGSGAGQGALRARPLPLHSGGRKGFRLMGEPTKAYFTPPPQLTLLQRLLLALDLDFLHLLEAKGWPWNHAPPRGLGLPLMTSPPALLVLTRLPFGD